MKLKKNLQFLIFYSTSKPVLSSHQRFMMNEDEIYLSAYRNCDFDALIYDFITSIYYPPLAGSITLTSIKINKIIWSIVSLEQ